MGSAEMKTFSSLVLVFALVALITAAPVHKGKKHAKEHGKVKVAAAKAAKADGLPKAKVEAVKSDIKNLKAAVEKSDMRATVKSAELKQLKTLEEEVKVAAKKSSPQKLASIKKDAGAIAKAIGTISKTEKVLNDVAALENKVKASKTISAASKKSIHSNAQKIRDDARQLEEAIGPNKEELSMHLRKAISLRTTAITKQLEEASKPQKEAELEEEDDEEDKDEDKDMEESDAEGDAAEGDAAEGDDAEATAEAKPAEEEKKDEDNGSSGMSKGM